MKRIVAAALVMTLLFSGLGMLIPGAGQVALAADRAVVVSTPYPSVTIGKGKEVSFSIQVANKGIVDEWLNLELTSAPEGWEPILKAGGFVVRQVHVEAYSPDLETRSTQMLTLSMTPPADVAPGDYNIALKATSTDGQVSSTLNLKIGISDDVSTGLKLNTQYPMLRGTPGATFEFKLDLVNDAPEDRTIAMSASAPEGWQVSFRPAYDQKEISSFRVKAGETQGVDVQVQTSQLAVPGDFPIEVVASAGTEKATAALSLTLAGNGKLALTTASGRYNADASAGSPTIVDATIQNSGVADLQNVTFAATAPDGWTVSFDPQSVTDLKAGAFQQVNVSITPSSKAIAGDYIVNVYASSGQISDTREIRVSVGTSTAWGILGILIVGIVLVGMAGLYTRLGRR